MVDNCASISPLRDWSVGLEIRDIELHKNAHWFFSLATDRSPKATVIYDHLPYAVGEWSFLTVTYDGASMSLFVNGVRVGRSADQWGILFGDFARGCKQLRVGGLSKTINHMRGYITGLRLWNTTLTRRDIKTLFEASKPNCVTGFSYNNHETILSEDFNDLNNWEYVQQGHPNLMSCSSETAENNFDVTIPECGHTICDNPAIIRSYTANKGLKEMKTLRYRIINIREDDGMNPSVTEEQIQMQHQAIKNVFR